MKAPRKQLTSCVLLLIVLLCKSIQAEPTNGPLRICPDNPRYFADADGNAILLVGSHVWYNLVDMGAQDPPKQFDYEAYLDWMGKYNHNFMRMWAWEMVKWDTQGNNATFRNDNTEFHVNPHPWQRTGTGNALDGKPKFDLTKFEPEYFQRLTDRIDLSRKRGIYVSVMLFEGWAMQRVENVWKSHPFNPENNPRDEFERDAIKAMIAGKTYFEKIEKIEGKDHLRAVTSVHAVMKGCISCHPDRKFGDLLGGIAYIIPLEE